jgi:hypothetical protein
MREFIPVGFFEIRPHRVELARQTPNFPWVNEQVIELWNDIAKAVVR